MANPLDLKEVVKIEEIVISNMFDMEALTGVLVRKGIVSKEEVMEEIGKTRGKKGG